MAWSKHSARRDGLPRWWPVTVRRILARDPVCRCPGCPKCATWGTERGHTNCIRASTDCDHIGDPTDHRDENLRGMCSPCHNHRSSRQGLEARAERKRPTGFLSDTHPSNL